MSWFAERETAARRALETTNVTMILAIGSGDLATMMRAARESADARQVVAVIDAERAALLATSEAARLQLEAVATGYAEAHKLDPGVRAPAALLSSAGAKWPVSVRDFDWAPSPPQRQNKKSLGSREQPK